MLRAYVSRSSLRDLDRLARSQIPFAETVALTRAANAARDRWRRRLPQRVEIRNRGLVKRWRALRAEKRTWPRLEAAVVSPDAFWVDQELGGIRRARGKTRTIPTEVVARRRTKGGRVPKSLQPRHAIGAGRAAALPGQIVRTSKRARDRRRILYLRRRQVRIRPVLGARPFIQAAAIREFERAFPKELAKAVAGRR